MNATDYAIDWWKKRHEAPEGYFPNMDQHKNWKLYDALPCWFMDMASPDKNDIALEIGCGYGQWMAPLSKLVERVDGFDIHQTLVDKFAEQMSEFPNAVMKVGDGKTIPFDGHYTLIYSISVFQHMPREIVKGYIQEAAWSLSNGGRCVFHFRHADNDGPYANDIVVDHPGDWSVGWTEEEVRAACVESGLEVRRVVTGGNAIIVEAVEK